MTDRLMKLTISAVVVLIVVAVAAPMAGAQSTPATGLIQVSPGVVPIDLRYNGATVNVHAEVPAGYQVAVLLSSHPGKLELKRLGKMGGILWMGVGQVSFENIPAVYQVLTSVPLSELGSAQALAECKLGYQSLIPDGVPGADLRADVVGLKERDGLFALQQGALIRSTTPAVSRTMVASLSGPGGALSGADAGVPLQVFEGSVRLPPRAPAGDYKVELIGFKDHQSVHLGSATLRLEYVGAALQLRRLAVDHGMGYGIGACLIAIIVGLLTGLLFRPKSDESH
jgi:hypothetical protein